MKALKQLSVANIWSEYYIKVDGDPHPYLKEKGYQSSVLAASIISDTLALPPDIYGHEVKIIDQTAKQSLFQRAKNKLMYTFYWNKINGWIGKKTRNIQPNILHIHFGYTAVRMLPLIKELRLPVVLTFYGVDASTMIADPKWVSAYKEAFQYVSYMIVLSEVVKNRMINLGFDAEKILVWHIPIRLEIFIYRQRQRTGTTRFITAARFVEKKGYPFLLSAFKKVHSLRPDTTLTIIGYGPGKGKIDAAIKNLGLEDVVSIKDNQLRPDFHSIYYDALCNSDIFVLPSTTSKNGDDEGGPALTLVSAQAAGLPVICTPFVGSEITVFDGVTGIYCNQDDPDSIAEKMLMLMDDTDLCDRLGKAASELVHPMFAREFQMEKMLDIYKGLVC